MQKREKIIIALVIIAAVYGAVDFTLNNQKERSVHSPSQSDSKKIVELTAQLGALSSPENQKFDRLAASIIEPWPEHFFAPVQTTFGNDKKADQTQDTAMDEVRDKASQLIYSGFLAMGTDSIAIINGMDYRVGDMVDGFTVTAISPEAVELLQRGITFTIRADLLPSAEQQGPGTK